MDAIILAAGRGNRLREFNPDGRPKSLLEFGGKSLLARELQYLAEFGVQRVELVVGYEADQVIEHVGNLQQRPDVSFAFNPHYEDGSVISLLAARERLLAGNDCLVMDADVLFEPRILQRLMTCAAANVFLFDGDFEPGDEPVKIAVHQGRMVEFRKRLAPGLEYDQLGESVGFFRFDAATCIDIASGCARYEAEGLGDAPHEEVLRDVLLADPARFVFEDISGLPWLEVDFPEDIERAVKEILPAISADYPGFQE